MKETTPSSSVAPTILMFLFFWIRSSHKTCLITPPWWIHTKNKVFRAKTQFGKLAVQNDEFFDLHQSSLEKVCALQGSTAADVSWGADQFEKTRLFWHNPPGAWENGRLFLLTISDRGDSHHWCQQGTFQLWDMWDVFCFQWIVFCDWVFSKLPCCGSFESLDVCAVRQFLSVLFLKTSRLFHLKG